MEGKRANRGGWWVILLSFVLVVALALTAAWRWAVAEEGTINGERASVYLDHVAAQMKARTLASDSNTVLDVDDKGLITVLKVVVGKPTLLEQWTAKFRRVLPTTVATRLPPPQSGSHDAASRIYDRLHTQAWSSYTNRFVHALRVLPEADAGHLGMFITGLGPLSESDAAILEATVKRFLASSQIGANDFAVELQMKDALRHKPVDPAWFARASSYAARRPSDYATFRFPLYLRLKKVRDNLAEPILKPLLNSQSVQVRELAKIEVWRRNRGNESFEAFLLRMSKEEPFTNFDNVDKKLKAELEPGGEIRLLDWRE